MVGVVGTFLGVVGEREVERGAERGEREQRGHEPRESALVARQRRDVIARARACAVLQPRHMRRQVVLG